MGLRTHWAHQPRDALLVLWHLLPKSLSPPDFELTSLIGDFRCADPDESASNFERYKCISSSIARFRVSQRQ